MKALIITQEKLMEKNPIVEAISLLMLPILNIPLIEHILRNLDKPIIEELAIFGDLSNKVLQRYSNINVLSDYNQVTSFIDKTTLILPANLIPEINLTLMLTFHNEHRSIFTMTMAIERDNNFICIAEPKALSLCPEIIEIIEGNGLETLWHSELHPLIYEPKGSIYCLNTIDDFYQINMQWLKSRRANGFFVGEQGFWIGKNTLISSSAYLLQPILIGNNCTIGEDSHIIGPMIIGDNVKIHRGTSLSESIILNDTMIESNKTVDRMIVYKGQYISVKKSS